MKIGQINLLFLNFVLFLINQAHANFQRLIIGLISFLAFFDRILRFVFQIVIDELQHEIAGVVRDFAHVVENFLQALFQEPLVGIQLNLQQIRHLENFFNFREALSDTKSRSNRMYLYH